MRPLPNLSDDADYDAHYRDDALLRPIVDALLEGSAHAGARLERWRRGSCFLYGVAPDRVLKVYAPPDAQAAATEEAVQRAAFMAALDPDVEVPEVLEAGGAQGWRWLVMRRLPGVCAADVWDDLDAPTRVGVAASLGDWMRRFHSDPGVQSVGLPGEWGDWARVGDRLRREVVARHERRGAPGPWLARVEPFMEGWRGAGEPLLVHADLHPGNLMLTERGGRWALSGVLDFADALRAPPAYDLGAPLVYMAGGDAELTRALVEAALGPDHGHTTRSLWRWILTHRFSNLGAYVRGAGEAGSMEELAEALLGAVGA
jgi:hygromycin-B 7''-O-kinase